MQPGGGKSRLRSAEREQPDLLRLNTAIPPNPKPSIYGLLAGDLAGFPNGRRVFDDVDEAEIEISPGPDPGAPRSHNQVHARTSGSRTGYTAVFTSVPAGDYTIWRPDGRAKASVIIHGGQVTEHHWD